MVLRSVAPVLEGLGTLSPDELAPSCRTTLGHSSWGMTTATRCLGKDD